MNKDAIVSRKDVRVNITGPVAARHVPPQRRCISLVLFSIVLSLAVVTQAAFAANAQKLSSGNNAFAFSLAKALANEKPGENIFISPYSISTALQMVRA